MGLWDLVPQSPTLGRVAYLPMLEALREAQQRLEARFTSRPASAGSSENSLEQEPSIF